MKEYQVWVQFHDNKFYITHAGKEHRVFQSTDQELAITFFNRWHNTLAATGEAAHIRMVVVETTEIAIKTFGDGPKIKIAE